MLKNALKDEKSIFFSIILFAAEITFRYFLAKSCFYVVSF